MFKFKKQLTIILVFALILTCAVGSLAYFTDRVQAKASVTTMDAGIVIDPDPNPEHVIPDDPSKPPYEEDPDDDDITDDITDLWVYLNSKALANYNPGDRMDLSYILKNEGKLAIDVRETFIITSSVAMTDSNLQFELFSAIKNGTYGGYQGDGLTAPAGATVKVEKLSTQKYKYTISSYTLSGSGTGETISGKAKEMKRNYYVVFDEDAGNAFQGASCTIDYVVEVKQHSEGANDWATAATGTLTVGGQNLPVVPAQSRS